jgi:RNA polymerase sigma-70 factor, ECF subfamily
MTTIDKFKDYLLVIARDQLRSMGEYRLEAMDLVQEAFVRAQARWDQYRGNSDAELAAWLRSILTNHLTDVLRKLGREANEQNLGRLLNESSVRLEKWLICNESTPRRRALKNEQIWLLSSALMKLPEHQRTAIELRYLRALSIEEICRQMKRSPASVGGLLQRGLADLRKSMQEES